MKFVKKLLRRLFKTMLLLAMLGGGGIGLNWLLTKSEPIGIPYRFTTVTRGNISELLAATGTISPEEVVTIGTQVSGKITQLYVKLNDEVKAGQLLAEIDPSIPLTQLKQSKAFLETATLSYTQAERDYQRTKALFEKSYVAKVDVERAWQSVVSSKNSMESAKITVERDEVNLGYTKVISPIDGIIIYQDAAAGQTVASNFQTPNLFKIARDMTVMKIDMSVPEADISKIHVGMPLQFTVDAFDNRAFDGTVKSIDLNPNNQGGIVTYNVIVQVKNPDKVLFPGMTANVTITLNETKDVVRVPAAALRFTPPVEYATPLSRMLNMKPKRISMKQKTPTEMSDGPRVYLWKDNELVQVPVELGASDDFYFQVKGDAIKEGDQVVTGMQIREE